MVIMKPVTFLMGVLPKSLQGYAGILMMAYQVSSSAHTPYD